MSFKVGDRVVLTKDNNGFGEKGDTGSILRPDCGANDCFIRFDREISGDRDWSAPRGNVELIPAAAEQQPLRIVAGRYYKTRDGRKVGPMDRNGSASGGYYWTAPECDRSYGAFWYESGAYHEGQSLPLDIIAEWPAVTSNAAAQVDNLADEYGPPVVADVAVAEATATRFKVGDRVGVVNHPYMLDENERSGVVTSTSSGLRGGYDVLLDNYSGDYLSFREEELVAEPPPPVDSALQVTISADTSALDAEIDRVKRRLKKLAKRARKLGVRLDYSDLWDAA